MRDADGYCLWAAIESKVTAIWLLQRTGGIIVSLGISNVITIVLVKKKKKKTFMQLISIMNLDFTLFF